MTKNYLKPVNRAGRPGKTLDERLESIKERIARARDKLVGLKAKHVGAVRTPYEVQLARQHLAELEKEMKRIEWAVANKKVGQ
jgi:succinate dehydrogenase/fumarate reductase flavoprotein subunit